MALNDPPYLGGWPLSNHQLTVELERYPRTSVQQGKILGPTKKSDSSSIASAAKKLFKADNAEDYPL